MTKGIIRLDAADDAAGGTKRPFSKAVRAGDYIYVSGQVPARDGEIIPGGIAEQTVQVMENIIEVLALADCSLEHVVKVNVWLDDPRDFLVDLAGGFLGVVAVLGYFPAEKDLLLALVV